MAPDQLPPFDAPEDDRLVVQGLERAVARARDNTGEAEDSDVDLASVNPYERLSNESIDTSAVMEVLRGAIDRYSHGDGHELGTWTDVEAAPPPAPRPLAATYEPGTRRIALIVVVLFVIFGGFAYAMLRPGGSSEVKTNPTSIKGQSVTTAARPTSTGASSTAPTSTEAPAPDAIEDPATTRPRTGVGTTEPPPDTEPPSTETTETTVPDTTTTTPTTEPTTTTASVLCGDPPVPC